MPKHVHAVAAAASRGHRPRGSFTHPPTRPPAPHLTPPKRTALLGVCRRGDEEADDNSKRAAELAANHWLANEPHVSSEQLRNETMLLLGNGHCFRDHVLEVCPEFARFSSNAEGIRKSFEGSSLETIKHMVAAGMGVTLVPRLSVPKDALAPRTRRRKSDDEPHVVYLPFEGDVPYRRVVLAWRRSFTRYEAIAALRNSIYACELPGVKRLS